MPITQFIHMTAAYSNAVLVAILPHVSDCARQLDLPIQQPITTNQVARFNASPMKDYPGGGLWLTNHYLFSFSFGCVDSFCSPDNWFSVQELEGIERYSGKDNMTTNQAIELARRSFARLGYKLEDCHVDEPPTSLEGPFDSKRIGHVPYCRVTWKSPEANTPEERSKTYTVQFDVDMQKKQIVGMFLCSEKFWKPDPKIDNVPILESDYRKQNAGKMFIRTNDIRSLRKAVHTNAD